MAGLDRLASRQGTVGHALLGEVTEEEEEDCPLDFPDCCQVMENGDESLHARMMRDERTWAHSWQSSLLPAVSCEKSDSDFW